MPLILYVATAAILLAITHRFIRPLSRSAAMVLFLLPFAFTGVALIGNRAYGPINGPYRSEPLASLRADFGVSEKLNPVVGDIYAQMFPWRRAVQLSLQRGAWPLWNPYILAGHLLAGNGQTAVYSPFTLIACLSPAATSFTFTASIAFFIAGLSSFLFAREFGCSETASMIAAIGWMDSRIMAVYILWPFAFAWTYFPLVLLATRRIAREPNARNGALLCIVLALMLVAGYPESALHIVILGTIYGAFDPNFMPLFARISNCAAFQRECIIPLKSASQYDR